MLIILIIIAFLFLLFLGSLYTMRILNKLKLKSRLKKQGQNGNSQDKIDTFLKVLRRNPSDLTTRKELIKVYMEQNNFKEAIIHLNNILTYGKGKAEIDEFEIFTLLAECSLKMENTEEAANLFAYLIKNYPDSPYPCVELGKLEKTRGNLEKACQYYSRALSLEPKNKEIVKELGILLFESQKYPEALSTLQDALEIDPDDAEVHYYIGEIKTIYTQPKDAFNHFLKSKNSEQFKGKSLFQIGKILRQFNKLEQAQKVFSSIVGHPDLDRDDKLEIMYELGEVFLAQGELQHALALWEKILSVTSSYRDVKDKLQQYEQTKSSTVLRAYMMAPRAEFIELCKKIAQTFAKNVVLIRTSPQRDSSVEIFSQAVYHNLPTTIMFKFFRGASNIGQLAVREFYEKIKETKAKYGVCITTSDFSEEARAFCEGRVLELLGKKELLRILSRR
jgi:tetratricopeptide (TPR) repeat protein